MTQIAVYIYRYIYIDIYIPICSIRETFVVINCSIRETFSLGRQFRVSLMTCPIFFVFYLIFWNIFHKPCVKLLNMCQMHVNTNKKKRHLMFFFYLQSFDIYIRKRLKCVIRETRCICFKINFFKYVYDIYLCANQFLHKKWSSQFKSF